MRPDESFIQQPVRSLQTMLRVLAEHDDRYVTLTHIGAAHNGHQRLCHDDHILSKGTFNIL